MMTITEAARRRALWKGQSAIETCTHLTLELEVSDRGNLSVGRYVCVVCGEMVAHA